MNRRLYNRLAALERVHTARLEAERYRAQGEDSEYGSRAERIRAYLAINGLDQLPTESIAETTCRALGYEVSELQLCVLEGRLGTELSKRFERTETPLEAAPR